MIIKSPNALINADNTEVGDVVTTKYANDFAGLQLTTVVIRYAVGFTVVVKNAAGCVLSANFYPNNKLWVFPED